MNNPAARYYKKDFWSTENLKYSTPHFRMEKAARLINQLTRGQPRTLLDVGCGPAALRDLLAPSITYHGIDIAIPHPAPDLAEVDFLASPIGYQGQRFDIVLAQGVFEYLGEFQRQKFAEIAGILAPDATFIVSYVNFGHRDREVYWPYNNTQPIRDFRRDLERSFTIQRSLPTSHNWRHSEPRRPILKAANMRLNASIPWVSPKLAVEYFFLCSARP
ncbi:MAG TPA: methyltransferase domain-containing protein [Streptosporangiaceae bacterium]